MPWNVTETDRGFERIEFTDRFGEPCRLQQSSAIDGNLAPESYEQPGSSFVWLGRDAFGQSLHLDREQVGNLVHHLTQWLKTGSFR